MKTIFTRINYCILFFAAIALMSSCKKGDDDKSDDSVSIKGKWTFVLEEAKTYKSGVLTYDVKDEGDGTSFLEITDDKAIYTYGDHETITYSYVYDAGAKTLKVSGGDIRSSYEIKTLTKNKLVIVEETERDGGWRDVYTTTYSR
jgi:hypothetical protein